LVTVQECIEPLACAASRAAPGQDRAGLRTRLAHALTDAAAAETMRRRQAAAAVQAAVRAALRAGAPSTVVQARALAANRGVLTAAELACLAGRLAACALARGRA
jgi:hypothetical protein